MRLKAGEALRSVGFWIGMGLLLCAFAPEAVAGALQAGGSSVWEAATALCLALISAVNGDRK